MARPLNLSGTQVISSGRNFSGTYVEFELPNLSFWHFNVSTLALWEFPLYKMCIPLFFNGIFQKLDENSSANFS